MAVVDASFVRALRTCDLSWFSALRLGEHGQQDDPSPGRYEVRDPGVATIEHEAQFAQRANQLTGERLVEQRAKLGKSVDVELGAPFRVVVESEVPGSDFVLKLDLASDIAFTLSFPVIMTRTCRGGDDGWRGG